MISLKSATLATACENKNLEMFSLSQKCQRNVSTASLRQTIQKYLITLEKLTFCFSSTVTNYHDWVRNLYSPEVEFCDTLDFAGARRIESTYTRP